MSTLSLNRKSAHSGLSADENRRNELQYSAAGLEELLSKALGHRACQGQTADFYAALQRLVVRCETSSTPEQLITAAHGFGFILGRLAKRFVEAEKAEPDSSAPALLAEQGA